MHIAREIFSIFSVLLAGLLATGYPVAASASDMPPLSAYGELPAIENTALCPSGSRIAALLTVNDKRLLVAFDENLNIISSTNVDTMKVRTFDWIGEDSLLLTYEVTEDLGYNFAADKYDFAIAVTIPVCGTEAGEVVFSSRRDLVDSIFGNYGIRQVSGR